MLVDDEIPIITMEKQLLERLGYKVTSRTSCIEALEAFRTSPDKFDLVITDFAMPNMSGDKFASALLEIRSDIGIILCTGFSEKMTSGEAKKVGINEVLLKPVMMQELDQKIRKVLDKNALKHDYSQ